MGAASMIPLCPYCGCQSQFVTGAEIYPGRSDLAHKSFYQCDPCRAWVGCHPGTTKPLGRLANAELRMAKMAAHDAFDPIWRGQMERGAAKKEARNGAYAWLANALGMPRKDCHIGMFDADQCRRVVEVCREYQGEMA